MPEYDCRGVGIHSWGPRRRPRPAALAAAALACSGLPFQSHERTDTPPVICHCEASCHLGEHPPDQRTAGVHLGEHPPDQRTPSKMSLSKVRGGGGFKVTLVLVLIEAAT